MPTWGRENYVPGFLSAPGRKQQGMEEQENIVRIKCMFSLLVYFFILLE